MAEIASKVLLGYELGTGNPVHVPIRHMAVTGQTQESGKTTTLEALVARSGLTALTFVTKRGESSFGNGRRITPYFRDRADWQFVDAILEAALQEKNKFLRQFLIPICRTTKTLSEVQAAVKDGLKKASGIKLGAFTQLDAYLELIVPEIHRANLAKTLDLAAGLNVMDVSDFTTPMQMLFVQSAIDWVNDHCVNTVVVIPEAWEFIPEGKGSPVKDSAVALVRKGAGLGNFIWVDSQDMAGVDKTILRGCTVWLVGVQREANEIKRNLQNMPNMPRPKADDVAVLDRGQFFACHGKTLQKVYVQPAWMSAGEAVQIARGEMGLADVTAPTSQKQQKPAPEDNSSLADAESRGFKAGLAAFADELNPLVAEVERAFDNLRDTPIGRGAMEAKLSSLGSSISAIVTRVSYGATHVQAQLAPPKHTPPDKDQMTAPTGELTGAQLAMLGAVVRSYPQPLDPRLWAVALGKSPESGKAGPWYKSRNVLEMSGFIEPIGNGFIATDKGINASDEKPVNPKDETALFALWRVEIAATVGNSAMSLLRTLAAHRNYRLTNEQWALLNGKSPASGKAGPWYGAIKLLREWGLIEDDNRFSITPKGCAVIPTLTEPRTDTAEAIRLARYALLERSQRHYDALTKPMTREELARALGVSESGAKAGPWYGAIKEMIEIGLVEDRGGELHRLTEDLIPSK